MAIEDNSFYTRPELVAAFNKAKSKNGRLHFLGLVSDGGVHSHITHLEALLTAAKQAGVPNTYVHFFSDGRDTSPVSGGGCVDGICIHVHVEFCIYTMSILNGCCKAIIVPVLVLHRHKYIILLCIKVRKFSKCKSGRYKEDHQTTKFSSLKIVYKKFEPHRYIPTNYPGFTRNIPQKHHSSQCNVAVSARRHRWLVHI